jgi:peptidoglycan/xylan/chitin deacetylase (PgdA/CDA1 family)
LTLESCCKKRDITLKRSRTARLLAAILLLGAATLIFSSQPLPDARAETASAPYVLTYTIDRSATPDLYHRDLTLIAYVGQVSNIQVSSDDPVDFHYDPSSGTVTFTAAATVVRFYLDNPTDLPNAGPFTKAPLKYDKKWAWSHGLDDNIFLQPSIQLFADKGWRATLYLIGKDIHDTRQEEWVVDAPDVQDLLVQGWSIGNHTWDHVCASPWIDDPDFMRGTILNGYNRLQEVVASSSVPHYRPTGFAAPCFRDEYHPYIQELKGNGETAVLFNEAGNYFRLIVSPSAGEYTHADKTAVPFSYEMEIGRDTNIGMGAAGVAAVKGEMDWLAANATSERHFWYNTISHGQQETPLSQVIDYAYHTYGPGGSNEMWVAPADEIYSYLLTRDRSQVSYAVTGPLNQRIFLPLIQR